MNPFAIAGIAIGGTFLTVLGGFVALCYFAGKAWEDVDQDGYGYDYRDGS